MFYRSKFIACGMEFLLTPNGMGIFCWKKKWNLSVIRCNISIVFLFYRLSIACDNEMYGCALVLKLDALANHLDECEHNPKRPLPCEKGCGFVIPKDEYKEHNCVRELRALIHTQQQKLSDVKNKISDQTLTINELKRELQLFKDFMRAMRGSNPAMRAIADQMERDEVVRWSSSLARARVTRWGGMISTPDDALQVMGRWKC